ncbi:hypothetical protein SAMN05443550_1234 [Pedobacter hartonius]|uniref:Uncharacterized protein n=1 Tax=Pedobacter hartonius TaxID=425514 RepID=A0A1H4HKA0_9SPHI|nr:hypothetical protein SAMN05443550_1234 [Pedobacter hartonius]
MNGKSEGAIISNPLFLIVELYSYPNNLSRPSFPSDFNIPSSVGISSLIVFFFSNGACLCCTTRNTMEHQKRKKNKKKGMDQNQGIQR